MVTPRVHEATTASPKKSSKNHQGGTVISDPLFVVSARDTDASTVRKMRSVPSEKTNPIMQELYMV